MSDNGQLRRGQLPPIPEGSGILPVAENRISPGPHPEQLDLVPEGFAPLETLTPAVNDGLEPAYRRVLFHAVGLASAALLLTAASAATLIGHPGLTEGLAGMPPLPSLLLQLFLILHVIFLGFCSRYVARLPMALAEDGKPARVLGKEVA